MKGVKALTTQTTKAAQRLGNVEAKCQDNLDKLEVLKIKVEPLELNIKGLLVYQKESQDNFFTSYSKWKEQAKFNQEITK